MPIEDIVREIDFEIARLKEVRNLLSNSLAYVGDGVQAKKPPSAISGRKRSTLSPEGRRRIAEAQRKRWAAKKKAAK